MPSTHATHNSIFRAKQPRAAPCGAALGCSKWVGSIQAKHMSELIILSKLSSYRQRLVVWYVAEKEAR